MRRCFKFLLKSYVIPIVQFSTRDIYRFLDLVPRNHSILGCDTSGIFFALCSDTFLDLPLTTHAMFIIVPKRSEWDNTKIV